MGGSSVQEMSITSPSEILQGEGMNSTNHSGCRFCGAKLEHTFVDLGASPLAQSFLSADQLNQMEPFYPLHVYVCGKCFLVQLQEFVAPENIFSDYLYFASYSDSWLAHAKSYTDQMLERFPITEKSLVVEIASNDGYLLQYFLEKKIPVLGIEPAVNVAEVAVKKGVPTLVKFFNNETALELVAKGRKADLLLGNNVLAHVPDVNSFVAGMKILLNPHGVITMEFPHLMRLMEENQFDTIYHEHFSYYSFLAVEKIFAAHGLTLFDVQELPTHGGSLRIFARHSEDSSKPVGQRVTELRTREESAGYNRLETYSRFAGQVTETKRKLLEFFIHAKRGGKKIAAYGAAAKGNTLLNYCAIRTDFLDYVVDRSPHKQGKFLPGARIPIYSPDQIRQTRPDFLLILPWNLKDEIIKQNACIRDWGGQFVVPIPELTIYP
jgi:SAM-dependent methyltransferase